MPLNGCKSNWLRCLIHTKQTEVGTFSHKCHDREHRPRKTVARKSHDNLLRIQMWRCDATVAATVRDPARNAKVTERVKIVIRVGVREYAKMIQCCHVKGMKGREMKRC